MYNVAGRDSSRKASFQPRIIVPRSDKYAKYVYQGAVNTTYVYISSRVDKWPARDNRARVRVTEGRRGGSRFGEEETKRGMENKKEKERKRKRREEKCPAVFYRDPKRVNEIPYRVAQQSLSPALSDIRQGRSSRFHPITHEFLALLHSVVAATLLRVPFRVLAWIALPNLKKNSRTFLFSFDPRLFLSSNSRRENGIKRKLNRID